MQLFDALQRTESWMVTFTGCKYDQENYSHNQLFPILFQNLTMVRLCGIAKCLVVISAHLNPLDQTRRAKCKLAVTLPSRKQVDIWSMCSRCWANAIKMVLKFSIHKNENCIYFLALFYVFCKEGFILYSIFEKQTIAVSDSGYIWTLVYQHKRLKVRE